MNVHEDIDYNMTKGENIWIKYLGNLQHPMVSSLLNHMKNGDSVVLEIIPNYYSTWNYGKR